MKSHGLTLYLKEIRASRLETLLGPGVYYLALLVVYVMAVHQRLPEFVPIVVAFGPFLTWPIVSLAHGASSMRGEWTHNTTYLLNSLPVRGWRVIAAKLGATATGYFAVSLVGGLAGFGMLHSLLHVDVADAVQGLPHGQFWLYVAAAYAAYSVVVIGAALVGQLAYLMSTLMEKLGWIAFVGTLAATTWLIGRGSQYVAVLFSWLPNIDLPSFAKTNGVIQLVPVPMDPAPIVGALVILVGLFVLAGHILEREAEV